MESINSIPIHYKIEMARLLNSGVLGWHGESHWQYRTFVYFHTILRTLSGIFGGNVPKISSYEELFPTHQKMLDKDPTGESKLSRAFGELFAMRDEDGR